MYKRGEVKKEDSSKEKPMSKSQEQVELSSQPWLLVLQVLHRAIAVPQVGGVRAVLQETQRRNSSHPFFTSSSPRPKPSFEEP